MKFSRKKLTFIPVLVLISAIIFPSFTALAADASYKFSAIDLKLKVPEELICFTQTTTGNNAYLVLSERKQAHLFQILMNLMRIS